jgi:hypothetical protein
LDIDKKKTRTKTRRTGHGKEEDLNRDKKKI